MLKDEKVRCNLFWYNLFWWNLCQQCKPPEDTAKIVQSCRLKYGQQTTNIARQITREGVYRVYLPLRLSCSPCAQDRAKMLQRSSWVFRSPGPTTPSAAMEGLTLIRSFGNGCTRVSINLCRVMNPLLNAGPSIGMDSEILSSMSSGACPFKRATVFVGSSLLAQSARLTYLSMSANKEPS